MAYVAACTDKGAKRRTNQDACCIQVANTSFGELLMAVVCDGVGGLAAGELASATVAYRFAQWFNDELPTLLQSMDSARPLNFDMVEMVWGVLLANLNEVIQTYGRERNERLGTTFTGILVSEGRYLVGHVGDCRLYQIAPRGVRQVTEDQTLLAKKLAAGELTLEEAKNFKQGHVILQSVGTEGLLRPAFYRGECTPNDLFVLCCDGAYRKAEEVGVAAFFGNLDHRNEDALTQACRNVLQYDLAHGEKDNLTVLCVSAELASREQVAAQMTAQVSAGPAAHAQGLGVDAVRIARDDDPDDDPITMIHEDDATEDDAPTVMESVSMNGVAADAAPVGEDGIATMAAQQPRPAAQPQARPAHRSAPRPVAPMAEDDIPTMVEHGARSNARPTAPVSEDDIPTMVEHSPVRPTYGSAGRPDEDDIATMVAGDEDDVATIVQSLEDDDLPTRVEGDDA